MMIFDDRKACTKWIHNHANDKHESLFQIKSESGNKRAVFRCSNSNERRREVADQERKALIKKRETAAGEDLGFGDWQNSATPITADPSPPVAGSSTESNRADGSLPVAESTIDSSLPVAESTIESSLSVAKSNMATADGSLPLMESNTVAQSSATTTPVENDFDCRRAIIARLANGHWEVNMEEATSHHGCCFTVARVTTNVIQSRCQDAISSSSSAISYKQMKNTARAHGVAGNASKSTLIRAFNEPQAVLEEEHDDNWVKFVPFVRKCVKEMPGSTIAIKTTYTGDTRVRLFHSSESHSEGYVQLSPVEYAPQPEGEDEDWLPRQVIDEIYGP
jgi:hypothetical protein